MIIGNKVYRTHTTSNSMAWAQEHMFDAPDGAVFLADVFTHAQGRQGRTWELQPGQLLVTFILKPKQLHELAEDDVSIRLNQLNMAISLGILDPLKNCGVQLKWPNDFIIQDKKMGGMLIHVAWYNQKPFGLIVGFALNINNQFLPEHPLFDRAISLKTATGSSFELRPLYKEILGSLNHWYNMWQQGEFIKIYKAWREHQSYLGKLISVHQQNGKLIEGIIQQVLPNGDLWIIDDQKKKQTISFYQVEEIKLKK